MVYGTYNELVTGAYKPTYNWGASHCDKDGTNQKEAKSLGGCLLAEEFDCDCLQDNLPFGNLT